MKMFKFRLKNGFVSNKCPFFFVGVQSLKTPKKKNGYLFPEVDLLQQVTKGQTLGKVISFSGEEIETIKSNATGVVICMRKTPSVKPDDIAFLITGIDNITTQT